MKLIANKEIKKKVREGSCLRYDSTARLSQNLWVEQFGSFFSTSTICNSRSFTQIE